MKHLLLFESFMESRYAPLYRYAPWFFSHDMINDKMIARIPSDELAKTNNKSYNNYNYKPKLSISFTRSVNYEYERSTSVRLKLDQNKLRLDGYIPHPIDEFNGKFKLRKYGLGTRSKSLKISNNFANSQDDYGWACEWEYEERIYSDINKLGEYIMSIQVPNISRYSKELESDELKNYLKKYPHIKMEEYDKDRRWKVKQIEI